MTKIIQSLILAITFTTPLCFANMNELKVATVKEMYSQSHYDESGKWVDGAPSDTELLHVYGGVKLKKAMTLYDKVQDMDCAETYPSLYVNEQRDDFNKVKLSKVYSLPNGRVRAEIKAYSNNGKTVNYRHDFSLICKASQCQINDVFANDNEDGYSLVEAISLSCKL